MMDDAQTRVWLRDLDGTGSMHACSMDDDGAVEYVRADLNDDLIKVLEGVQDSLRTGINFSQQTQQLTVTAQGVLENVLAQMDKGNWVDDHGHEVMHNVYMTLAAELLYNLTKFNAFWFAEYLSTRTPEEKTE